MSATILTGDVIEQLRTLPDASVQCCVTSPPYFVLSTVLWYNISMRNKQGQFVKGERAHPETEFQPGQHWRKHKPYWEKAWLETEYVEKGRTAADIAAEFGVTENAINFWMKKHGIPGRTMTEIRAQKHWGLSGEKNGMYGKRGAEVPNWKGGCTPARQQFYASEEWARAALAVWKRDDGRCVRCGISSIERVLHIHHIVSFNVPELRAEPSNLVLLCVKCHHFVHGRQNTAREYIEDVMERRCANGS